MTFEWGKVSGKFDDLLYALDPFALVHEFVVR